MRSKMWREVFSLMVLAAAAISVAAAQGPTRQGQPMGPGRGMMKYDPSTEITLKGSIEEVKEMDCANCGPNMKGTHLVVKTADGKSVEVDLGPARFLSDQKFSFQKGDSVEIVGSKVTMGNTQTVIAREVKKGDQTLTLRDSQGMPRWSMGRRSGS